MRVFFGMFSTTVMFASGWRCLVRNTVFLKLYRKYKKYSVPQFPVYILYKLNKYRGTQTCPNNTKRKIRHAKTLFFVINLTD